jgi:hypothetical protein
VSLSGESEEYEDGGWKIEDGGRRRQGRGSCPAEH